MPSAILYRPMGLSGPPGTTAGSGVPTLGMLLAHRFRRYPRCVLELRHDPRGAERRVPVHLSDADRERPHDRRRAGLRRRVPVEPVFRQVDHDALARRARQQPPLRHDHLGAGARQPGVHARIRVRDLFVAEAMAAREVEQRVLRFGEIDAQLADRRRCRRPAAEIAPPPPGRRRTRTVRSRIRRRMRRWTAGLWPGFRISSGSARSPR